MPQIQTAQSFYSNISNLVPGSGYVFPVNGAGFDLSTRPSVYNYNFGIQRDLGHALLADVKYVGSLGRHLIGATNVNALPLGASFRNPDPTLPTSPCSQAAGSVAGCLNSTLIRPYLGYADINIMTANGSSNYNSLQATLNRRYSKGLQFGGAFTYSKSMDYNSTTRANGDNYTPKYLTARRNYGPSNFDQKYVFSVNWQYDIPGLRSAGRLVSGVTHDWVISGVGVFNTGTPNTVLPTLLANTLGGGDSQRVNLTCNPNLDRGSRTATNYFDTTCIQYPGATYGNEGRNVVRGPGRNNFDASVMRSFKLGSERRVMIFRFEAYNMFNHTQLNTIDTAPRYSTTGAQINTTFGQALTAYPARQLQFSLRARF